MRSRREGCGLGGLSGKVEVKWVGSGSGWGGRGRAGVGSLARRLLLVLVEDRGGRRDGRDVGRSGSGRRRVGLQRWGVEVEGCVAGEKRLAMDSHSRSLSETKTHPLTSKHPKFHQSLLLRSRSSSLHHRSLLQR